MRSFKKSRRKFVIQVLLLLMVTNDSFAQKYLFYLHGAIMEGQHGNAMSPYYGEYEYDKILEAFRKADFIVVSEVRKSNTDIIAYAHEIANQIDNLLKKGVEAKNITVVGASKGALIAMHASSFLKNNNVNFVFLAACNDGNFKGFPDIRFHGNILSIYEKSDDIGASCAKFKDKAAATINHYKEIEINTGLNHGFLFRPLPDWVNPAIAWANGNY